MKHLFDKYLNEKVDARRQVIINNMTYAAEEALKQARNNHRYITRSGNLQSSVGYAIIDNGKVIRQSSFEVVREGKEGARRGREYLSRLIAENGEGMVLIMVAGMNYAKYVEAMNLDVLDSAEQICERVLKNFNKQLNL